MKKVSVQFIKYFGIAGIGYIADFGLMVLLKEMLDIHYLLSASAGFAVGLLIVYLLSGKYVFGVSKLKSRRNEFLVFALIGVVGLGILNILMWTMTSGLRVSYLLSKILATVVVYMWNFFARRALYYN